MLKKIVLVSFLSVSSLLAYHSAELNLNNLDLGVKLDFDIGQFNDNVDPDTTFVGLGYMKVNKKSSLKPSLLAKDPSLIEMSFLKRQALSFLPDMSVGIGMRVNGSVLYNGVNDDTYVSVPLGVELEYHIPVTQVNVHLGAKAYYAPQVLSFYDATNYKEFNGYLEAELIPQVAMKVGYRHIDFNYAYNINSTVYAGLKFDF